MPAGTCNRKKSTFSEKFLKISSFRWESSMWMCDQNDHARDGYVASMISYRCIWYIDFGSCVKWGSRPYFNKKYVQCSKIQHFKILCCSGITQYCGKTGAVVQKEHERTYDLKMIRLSKDLGSTFRVLQFVKHFTKD